MRARRLDFRQSDSEDWHPWETVEEDDQDVLDLAVLTALEAYELLVEDEAVALTITAWDGSQIEYVALPRERTGGDS